MITQEDWTIWEAEQERRVVELPETPEIPENYHVWGRSVNLGRYLDDTEHFCDQAAIQSLEHAVIACALIPIIEKLEQRYDREFQIRFLLPIMPGEEEVAYIKSGAEIKPCKFPDGIRKAMWQTGATTIAAGKYFDEPGFAITYSTYKRQITQIVNVYGKKVA